MILIEVEAAEVEAEIETMNGDAVEIVQGDIIIVHLPATAMIAIGIETGMTTTVIASGRRNDATEKENMMMVMTVIVTASSEVRIVEVTLVVSNKTKREIVKTN